MAFSERKKTEILKELLERYQAFVMKVAYSYVRDTHRAQDISQEVFLDAYGALDRLRDYDKLSTWLKLVTRNKCVDYLKKHKGKIIFIDEYNGVANGDEGTDGRETIYGKEMQGYVMRMIDSLPGNQRQALILRHTEHVSYREIARTLGITVSALKSVLFRARCNLRREMEKMETQASEDAL